MAEKIKGGPDLIALYTKSPSSSYKFVESHDFYVKDVRQIPKTLLPPAPHTRSKSEFFDVSEYLLVDDKAIRVPLTTLSKPISALVDYLVEGYEDDVSKVRVLFRWVTNQPLSRMAVLQTQPKVKDSALHHLWMIRNRKQRYSKFFSLLCRYAGLYAVNIHGAVKGIHYQIGDRISMEKHYGEWNAVLVDGTWRLVDALWGACGDKDPGDGRGRFSCDERFFFTDPKDLMYTHFAATPKWQLLDSPRHIDSFEESVCLKNRFFDFGMQVLSHPLCEIQAEDGEVELIFGIKPKQGPDQRFNCYISHFDRPESKRYLTKGSNTSVPIFIHRLTESSVSIRVRFPESGIYRMEIVGKQVTNGSLYKDYDWIAIYKVIVEEPADRGFPKMDPIGWGPGSEIAKVGLAPFNYTSGIIVAKNIQTKIRFKIVDTNHVQNMKFFFRMASTYDNDFNVNALSDKFEVDVNIMTFLVEAPPFGEYTLKMFARNVRGSNVPMDQRRECNVCNYLLISDIQQKEVPLGILTEKTEIEDTPELPRKLVQAETRRPPVEPIPSTEKPPEIAESIVSTSNVLMESSSQPTTSLRNSPELNEYPVDNKTPEPPEPVTNVTISPRKSPTAQNFVRVDADLQEIPEIPLNVVLPVQPEIVARRPSEKREMKAVSSNKVVPMKSVGAQDDSIVLVPDDKPKRPGSSIRRTASRDDTKYFTALAKVRGDK
ncbi:HIL-like protein [Mya arenaria]|uniref:HIL-like protein n=1 Tax=Mya arenaria TaxID=6604 RepID=A0ABY7EXS0_MYAAR|nr:HIL-like protein [Mya arenaria]